jgi:hypothetical protein
MVESQVGPIIIIMNQYARMVDGKTIHSSGQMEHFKAIVNEKSLSITGEVPRIEAHSYRSGLACFLDPAGHLLITFRKVARKCQNAGFPNIAREPD